MKFLVALGALILAAPLLAPYSPSRQFDGYPFAPPMVPHVRDDTGTWHAPFAYPIRAEDPIDRRYAEDRSRRLVSFTGDEPWFLLGSDPLGRDVLSRLLFGARLTLGVAVLATLLAVALGALIGGLAGYAGGPVDTGLMRIADLVIVLPAIYVVLALRGAMPLHLTDGEVFTALVAVLSLVGWPTVARGVRAIISVERHAEYAEAARASGAGAWRLIVTHLLPATRGFLGVQATLLVPAFVMAEATLSFIGLGFEERTPSWGRMLDDARAVHTASDAPWLLAPAAAIVATVFVVHSLNAFRDRKNRVVIGV